MSLTVALGLARSSLTSVEKKMSIVSQNITNADVEGYTRKQFVGEQLTTNAGTYIIRGQVYGNINHALVKDVINDSSVANSKATLANILASYGRKIGNLPAEYSLGNQMDNLFKHLNSLAASPEDTSFKTQIVNDAVALASYLRDISTTIQDQRRIADNEMAGSVTRINQSLTRISELNDKIAKAGHVTGTDTSNYDDERMLELEKLASEIDIKYYTTDDGRIQIYHPAGQPLLLSDAKQLTFDAATSMNSGLAYPGSLGGIMLNGVDITTSIKGGALQGAIEARDIILVQEQDKLNELTTQLLDQVNKAMNNSASRPPRATMESAEFGMGAGTAFTGTGIVRVAVTDQAGIVQSFQDIDISAFATVGDVVAALNGVPGMSASLTAEGRISLAATAAGSGIAFNEMSSSAGADGKGFSHYFGFNNMFIGTGSENINISRHLATAPQTMSAGTLSSDPALAVGQPGVTAGDGTGAKAIADSLYENITFDAAGNFQTQTNSLVYYSQLFMSDAVTRADVANTNAETATMLLTRSKDLVTSNSGVNVNEETASLIDLESQYGASATVIQTIRTLFDALLNAVN